MNKGRVILPKWMNKYFWGDDLQSLSWSAHQNYIVKTILEIGDRQAVKWLFKKVDKRQLKSKLARLKLTPKSKNFWLIYLK